MVFNLFIKQWGSSQLCFSQSYMISFLWNVNHKKYLTLVCPIELQGQHYLDNQWKGSAYFLWGCQDKLKFAIEGWGISILIDILKY